MGMDKKCALLLVTLATVMGCVHTRDLVTNFPSYLWVDSAENEVSREVHRFDLYMRELNSMRNSQIKEHNRLSKAASIWGISNGTVTLAAVSAGQAATALDLDPTIAAVSGVTVAVGGLSIFVMELSGIKGRLSNAHERYLSTKIIIQEADLKFRTLADSLMDSDPKIMSTALRELKNLNAKLQQFIALGDI